MITSECTEPKAFEDADCAVMKSTIIPSSARAESSSPRFICAAAQAWYSIILSPVLVATLGIAMGFCSVFIGRRCRAERRAPPATAMVRHGAWLQDQTPG